MGRESSIEPGQVRAARGAQNKRYSHLKNGSTKLFLDFSGVSHLDSQGLEMLLDSYEELKKHGGDIKLCNVNQLCTDILIATRLRSFLEVYNNTEEAAQSYL